MKKGMKFFAGVLAAFILFVSMMPSMTLRAETTEKKTYTVTFRAGNVGSFNLNANNTSGDNIEATENYIKFTVEKGESLSSTFDFFSDDASLNAYFLNVTSKSDEADETNYIDLGYRLKSVSDWCSGAAEATVNRNTEYVLDYAKLVNPVKYIIRFVDESSGEQIAPPTIAYGNADEEITCSPLLVNGYSTSDSAVTIILNAVDESKNVVTFHYTYTGVTGTVVETVTEYTPGDTILETVVNEIPGVMPAGAAVAGADAGANAGAGGADAGNVTIEDEETPLADGADGNVTIEDEETPLADGDQKEGTTDIADEETPLAAGNEGAFSKWLAPVLGGVLAAIAVIAATTGILLKKKKSAAPVEKNDKKKEN